MSASLEPDRRNPRYSRLICLAVGLTVLSTALSAYAADPPSGHCRWTDELAVTLGIEAKPPSAIGKGPQIVEAYVADEERISAAGLYGSRRGERIKLICIGEDSWRIKNYRSGLAVTITVDPTGQ